VEGDQLQKLKEKKDAQNAGVMARIRTRVFPVQVVMGWGRYKNAKVEKNKIRGRIIY